MKRFDYLLAGVSGTWCVALLVAPYLVAWDGAFYTTVGMIVVNLLASLVLLIRLGKVQVVLNLAQLPLFCLLNYQLYRAFGEDHYRWDTSPTWWDWVELTGVHFLRAVDVLDGMEEYGIDLQNVEHKSVLAGLLLVWMHVTVDIFLLSLVFRWISKLWRHRYAKQRAKQLAPYFRCGKLGGLVLCALLVLGCGLSQDWKTSDWLLWPLDNVLRTLDIGDMFQIFDWRLHGVEMGVGTMTLAISFRFFAGIYAAEWLNYFRLTEFEGLGATVDDLIDALGSGSPAVVNSASESLLLKGPAIVPSLIAALHDDDVRTPVTNVLARFGPVAAPALIKALDDSRPEVRASSAHALGHLGPAPGVAPALSRALLDPDATVRVSAIESLGHMGPPALVSLSRALGDQSEAVRLAAVTSLGMIGPPALDVLCKALGDSSEQVRYATVAALAPLGGAASAALIGAMQDPADSVRASSIWAVARSPAAPQAARELAAVARGDACHEARRAAVWGLGRLSGWPPAEGVLISALDDADADVNLAAVDALSRYGHSDAIVDALIGKLGSSLLRPAVVSVLASLGSAAVPRLIAAQTGDDAQVCQAAADVLVGMGPPVVEPLVQVLRQGEPRVRKPCLVMLARIRPAESVARSLVPALGDSNVAFSAGRLLMEFGRASASALTEALAQEDTAARAGAAQLLCRLGPLATEDLCAALVDPRPLVRDGAAGVLREMGNIALPALRDTLERGGATGLRVAAAELLGKFGPTSEVVRSLLSAQASEDAEVRRAAAHVLNSFGTQVLPALVEMLADAPLTTRQIALRAIVRLGKPAEAVPVLIRSLADPALRVSAVNLLGELGPRGLSATKGLCEIVQQGTIPEQIAAISALGRIGLAPGVVPVLIERLFVQVPDVREAASQALHGFGAAAAPALVTALGDPNPHIRQVAAQTLGRVAAPDKAVPALIQALADGFVRPTAALALGQIGPPAADAVPSLQYMLRVGDPTEKQVAYEALRRIGV